MKRLGKKLPMKTPGKLSGRNKLKSSSIGLKREISFLTNLTKTQAFGAGFQTGKPTCATIVLIDTRILLINLLCTGIPPIWMNIELILTNNFWKMCRNWHGCCNSTE